MSGGSAFAARPEPPPRVRFADLDDSAPSACAAVTDLASGAERRRQLRAGLRSDACGVSAPVAAWRLISPGARNCRERTPSMP